MLQSGGLMWIETEFYNQDNTIRQQTVDEFEMPTDFGLIPWGHHIEIFTRSKSVNEALFYIEETIHNSWSRSELGAKIDDNIYGKQGRAITNFDEKLPAPYSGLAKAILRSPYDFRFIDKKIITEKQLEDELAANITRFLLELGQGFAYVGSDGIENAERADVRSRYDFLSYETQIIYRM